MDINEFENGETGKSIRYVPYIGADQVKHGIAKHDYQSEAEKKAFEDGCRFAENCFAITFREVWYKPAHMYGLDPR